MLDNKIDIDPFKIFNIEYKFDIQNLDEIYYELYKKNINLSEVNLAYSILKDKIKRLKFLCFHFVKNKNIDMNDVFKMKMLSNEEQNILKQNYINLAKEYALNYDWESSYKYLMYVLYLNS